MAAGLVGMVAAELTAAAAVGFQNVAVVATVLKMVAVVIAMGF